MTRHNNAALAQAVREILDELVRPALSDLPTFFRHLFWSTLLPLAAGLLLAALFGIVLQRLWRLVHPPSAAEWHRQALWTLQQQQQQPPSSFFSLGVSKSSSSSVAQAEALLWKAVEEPRDASSQQQYYTPAMLSLAALYIYHYRNGPAATKLLDRIVVPNKDTGDTNTADLPTMIRGLRLDAEAVAAGQYRMVQSELRRDEFLSVAFAARRQSTANNNNNNNNPKKPQPSAASGGPDSGGSKKKR